MSQEIRKQILITEDSKIEATLLNRVFEENHMADDVELVDDGEEVLAYLRHQGKYAELQPPIPAAVFLDIKMSRMSGIEVLQKIREDPKLSHLPVVIFSTSNYEGDLIKCYRLGANSYIVKPVDFEEYCEAIKIASTFWLRVNKPPPEGIYQ